MCILVHTDFLLAKDENIMKLNLEQVKKITTGAVKIEEKDNFFSFSRFTDEQLNLYKTNKQDLYQKTLSSAGVKLSFKTTS